MALEKRKTPLSLETNDKSDVATTELKKKETKTVVAKTTKKEKVIEPVETTVKSFSKRVNPLTINETVSNVPSHETIKEPDVQVEPSEVEPKVLPNLPASKKNGLVLTFVRKDVLSILKTKMNLSTKDILNKAIETLLKDEFEDEYIKLAKGE